eukprot:177066-Rhodomonas_salina.1
MRIGCARAVLSRGAGVHGQYSASWVGLNDEQYAAKTFKDAGFNHYHIYFDDCTVPDMSVVTQV